MTRNQQAPHLKTFTLGCKVNLCDTSSLAEAAAAGGLSLNRRQAPADVVVINTCAVTARGVARARNLVRRVRAAEKSATLIVVGCGVRIKDEMLLAMEEADLFLPTAADAIDWLARRYGFEPERGAAAFSMERTRAFVKIQDGCESFCSYCVVPLARGPLKSVPLPGVMETVGANIAAGYREIVLSGIHLGQYGRDLGGVTLCDVLRALAAQPGEFRVRLSSIEPLEVTDEMLEIMSDGRFCQHLHLPLQSGSDRILAAMGRPYDSRAYARVLERARKALNNPAVTTDIIVGFPGETEEDHEATVGAAREAGFARSHVFVYSPRPGTAAAAMPGRVDAAVARRRSGEVRAVCAETARAFRAGLAGTAAEVLPEERLAGRVEGFCRRYQRIRFEGGRELVGKLVNVSITGSGAGDGETLEGVIA